MIEIIGPLLLGLLVGIIWWEITDILRRISRTTEELNEKIEEVRKTFDKKIDELIEIIKEEGVEE